MKVQVLTAPGCSACARAEKMLDELGVDYETVDITENPEILETYRIFTTPGIVIDGELAFEGVPGREKLLEALEGGS